MAPQPALIVSFILWHMLLLEIGYILVLETTYFSIKLLNKNITFFQDVISHSLKKETEDSSEMLVTIF
jgi:hypothetical protein